MKFHYVGEDQGNCRVYYKTTTTPKRMYCFQESPVFGMELLSCSKDGEPEAPVCTASAFSQGVEQPPQGEAETLTKWAKSIGFMFEPNAINCK